MFIARISIPRNDRVDKDEIKMEVLYDLFMALSELYGNETIEVHIFKENKK